MKVLRVLLSLLLAAMLTVWAAPADADHINEGNVRFKTTCGFDHSAQDDPITAPALPGGAAHMHDFAGRRQVDAYTTTFAQLQAGTTTCNDSLDHAAYWVPSLQANGMKVNPLRMTAYYRLNGKHGPIYPYPEGLKVIAGYSMTNPSAPAGVTGWQCNGVGIPKATPSGCTTDLAMRINFPDCWDGANLDSTDHRLHMAYAVDTGPSHVCPATHPVQVPALTTYWHYGDFSAGTIFAISSGDIQYGVHADFINGWNTERMQFLIDTCLMSLVKCPSGG